MNKFSIVIPCYNASKYLERCLDSIYNQSYNMFEVIIVNDGSTDNTEEIVNRYRSKYNNIKYLKQENLGVAIARNKAIELVSGNKFIFVDADDYINSDLLFKLDEFLKKNDVDIVRYQADFIDIDGNIGTKYISPNFDILNGRDAIEFFVKNKIRYGPLWLYCYDTEFYKSNEFKFIEGKIHEDFYNIYILSKAESIGNINYIGYNYIKNNQSITSNKNRLKEIERMKDILYVYDNVIKKIKDSYKGYEKEFNDVLKDISMFLDVGLKHLSDDIKSEYEEEISLRKRKKY